MHQPQGSRLEPDGYLGSKLGMLVGSDSWAALPLLQCSATLTRGKFVWFDLHILQLDIWQFWPHCGICAGCFSCQWA